MSPISDDHRRTQYCRVATNSHLSVVVPRPGRVWRLHARSSPRAGTEITGLDNCSDYSLGLAIFYTAINTSTAWIQISRLQMVRASHRTVHCRGCSGDEFSLSVKCSHFANDDFRTDAIVPPRLVWAPFCGASRVPDGGSSQSL